VTKEILEGVKLVEKEKGIEPGTLLSAIEDALLAAYRKMPDAQHPVRVDLDRETGDFTAWSVTPDAWASYLEAHPEHHVLAEAPVEEPETFGAPPVAVEEEPEPEPEIEWGWFGDDVLVDVTPENFSRIAGQTAKQVLRQRINEAERSMMYDEYADRVGEIVTGIVQQDDHRYAFVDLGRMEAILPGSEKVPGERYEQGSRIKAVIIEVRAEGKGPQVVLSRRSDDLIRQLFELEVPEIADGLVHIRAVAREPGYRAKIAVESRTQGVDPVGACVGPRGSRVRMVVSELRGEKIDIIPWNDEPARFVAKALAPAKVREVYVDDDNRQATVIVPDGELSLAIGREGLNARLAHRLTGWRIDIVSETEYHAEEAETYTGVDEEQEDDNPGRCVAVTSSGKRCPNQALEGSRYCGVPAHRELAAAAEGAAG
jgi:transcription termination/antitermination protein NusA